MSARRDFLRSAYAFLFTAACDPDRLFAPKCLPALNLPVPDPVPELRDVYVVDDYSGVQLGTKDRPYSVTAAADFDALLQSLRPISDLALHFEGLFQTSGVYRWGQYASRNLGRGWTVDGDAEIALAGVTDFDSQPIYCLAGPARSVTGISLRGNHSALVDGWPGTLRTGGVLLEGDGALDRVTFRNFGSLGSETFVAVAAIIRNCRALGFVAGASDTQVTVWFTGDKRPFALHEGNEIQATPDVWVQGHAIYEADCGVVRNNRTTGARIGYYADFFTNKNRTIEGNAFKGCEHGVQLQLSPTPTELAVNFSHEDYTIGWNEIESSGANVSLNTVGPSTATRFIRNIVVDQRLSLENYGATDVRRETLCRMAA